MPIAGIGSDIVSIARIRQVLRRHPQRFAQRILSEAERADLARSADAAAFLARRFAAKEAAAKALGTGISRGIAFTDFCVSHSPSGQPVLKIRGRAQEIMDRRAIASGHLSISDDADYAVAFVVLETR